MQNEKGAAGNPGLTAQGRQPYKTISIMKRFKKILIFRSIRRDRYHDRAALSNREPEQGALDQAGHISHLVHPHIGPAEAVGFPSVLARDFF